MSSETCMAHECSNTEQDSGISLSYAGKVLGFICGHCLLDMNGLRIQLGKDKETKQFNIQQVSFLESPIGEF